MEKLFYGFPLVAHTLVEWPRNSTSGYFPKCNRITHPSKTCIHLWAHTKKKPKCNIKWWMDKVWYIHMMEYYLATKWKTTNVWNNMSTPQKVLPWVRGSTHKRQHCMIPFMWHSGESQMTVTQSDLWERGPGAGRRGLIGGALGNFWGDRNSLCHYSSGGYMTVYMWQNLYT